MSNPSHIVIVDDHTDIRELVARYLQQQGYIVTALENGVDLRHFLEREKPDLIILDIMMPGEDGLSLCRHVQATTHIPMIFLSAMADDLDKVLGLELGADDYVTKPFNPRELLARVKVVLRRMQPQVPVEPQPGNDVVRFGHWTLNLKLRELLGVDGVSVSLSTAEFKLICALLEKPGEILSRDELLDKVSGRNCEAFDRSVDNQISRLRRKIEDDPRHPQLIRTHWGGGYSFVGDVVR